MYELNIPGDMTCSIHNVYFYEAISKCEVQHTKKTNVNWVAGASNKICSLVK